jgi:site-specific DNA-methyltransferase (adenine-specific)
MTFTKGMRSSKTDEWETPQWLFDELDAEFHFTIDSCATKQNAKCKRYFTKKEDGLSVDWKRGEVIFMNPPYGREIRKWVKKAFYESEYCRNTIVCLLPSRTDTKWWHEYCMQADEIRYIKGRLKFSNSNNSAPFPSAIVIFRARKW